VKPPPPKARGAAENNANRFEALHIEVDAYAEEDAYRDHGNRPPLRTRYYRDDTRSIITKNASPDIGFNLSLNPYRGCEHGCAYCYARPYHEYLGFSSGLDFESQIMVKEDAPRLLHETLEKPRYQPQPLAMSGVTDCYQPVERHLQITRRCLEVLRDFRHPVGLISKNHLISRDSDLLAELATYNASTAFLSVTTLDAELARKLEPRTSSPRARLDAIHTLSSAGVPVGVSVAPLIPGLNDHEIPQILDAAQRAGATSAFYTVLRLPYAVKDIFSTWLDHHAPGQKEKILNRVRELRGGDKLYDPDFATRLKGQGAYARDIATFFKASVKRFGLNSRRLQLSTENFRRVSRDQPELF